MKLKKIEKNDILKLFDGISFKTEENLTSRGFIFFYVRHQAPFTKEDIIGKLIEVFG